MNPDRWQEIKRLYNTALELESKQREAFLEEACAGDESLRREIDLLLARQPEAEGLFASPATDLAAQELARDRSAEPSADLTGSTLLHYSITRKIGSGGMGEVYQACDLKLSRQVALKILPDSFAHDPERLARFDREAKLLASLTHQNIAAIYGLEEEGEEKFLVLELVEGQTLAQRIKKGPLPLHEVLELCRQIAEGLEAAHEKGVIHRDLKPANVMIAADDKIKILDFGLAKAFSTGLAATAAIQSPTITEAEAMTGPGMILGTAAYMSPEQARGKTVDKRADVWAFGCILYECLTGKRPFEGDTVTETLAAILKGEPDWAAFPPAATWKLRDLVHRCLRKDPRERLHDIADGRIEIVEALSQPAVREPVAAIKGLRTWKKIALFLGLLVVGMATAVTVILLRTPPAPIVRSNIDLPAGTQLTAGAEPTATLLTQNRTELALSPDGRFLVYSAGAGGLKSKAKLYLRPMNRAKAEEIQGTEGGRTPFFSPDGQWLGFWAQRKLWKVPASGGIPSVLCDAVIRPPTGANWGLNGSIVIGNDYELQSVAAGGGKLERLIARDQTREYSHGLPHFLPGGKALLFTVMPHGAGTKAHIEALAIESGKRKILIEEGADARYVASGHLVYVNKGTLMAAPFNPDRLELQGPAVPVVEGLKQAINLPYYADNSGAGQFAVSQSGSLAYVSGGIAPDADIELVWIDRQGKVEPLAPLGEKRPATNARLSPDGQRLACTTEGINANAWVYDLARGVATKLTNEGRALKVIWTPEGNRVTLDFSRGGNSYLAWLDWERSGSIEPLSEQKHIQWPGAWSPDSRFLAFIAFDPLTRGDIYLLRMKDRQVEPFIKTKASEGWPEFSPDGHWLAYSSDESGRYEVYVTSFPAKDRKITISNQGGCEPLWARKGNELFYWDVECRKLMVVDIVTQPAFRAETPRVLFEYQKAACDPTRCYDITPDGRRFLTERRAKTKLEPVTELNLVFNWFEELERLCPSGKK